MLEYNNQNIRFIRLLLGNQIAYIFHSNDTIYYFEMTEKYCQISLFRQSFQIPPGQNPTTIKMCFSQTVNSVNCVEFINAIDNKDK